MQASQSSTPLPLPDRIAIFTDFDGTLVDIAPTPDAVAPPAGLAEELEALSEAVHGAFAIVTGRPLASIDHFLAPASLPVAGSHGAERRRADGSLDTPDVSLGEAAAAIARALAPLGLEHRALIIESKPAGVALHYRQAPELAELCLNAMTKLVAAHPDFMVLRGKMVIEARPRRFSKGEAMRAFMQESPFVGRMPLFIGDDVTDEDGFVAAQAMGGVGLKLGAGDTVARLRIPDVAAVHKLFAEIAGQRHPQPADSGEVADEPEAPSAQATAPDGTSEVKS
jgi:trehalose 6-phosphate phosphatase